MRRKPVGVDGVTGPAAAKVVVDAPLGHGVGGDQHGARETLAAAPAMGAPEQVEARDMGELGRLADAAVAQVDMAHQGVGGLVGGVGRQARTGRLVGLAGQRIGQRLAVLLDLLLAVAEGVLDRHEHIGEAGAPVTWRAGKVGAAPEGFTVGCQEHGQRPAALLAQQV